MATGTKNPTAAGLNQRALAMPSTSTANPNPATATGTPIPAWGVNSAGRASFSAISSSSTAYGRLHGALRRLPRPDHLTHRRAKLVRPRRVGMDADRAGRHRHRRPVERWYGAGLEQAANARG